MDNRPYDSFKAFVGANKGLISDKKMVQLIKSGMFQSFCSDTRQNMIAFVKYIVPKKDKLTTVALKKIGDLVPAEYQKFVKLYQVKNELKNGLKVDSVLGEFFVNNVPLDYELDDEKIMVNQKEFNKWFNKEIAPIKDWLKTEEALELEVKVRRKEFWKENCSNTVEQWYFEALNFYPYNHFLSKTNLDTMFDYQSFNEIPATPQVETYVGKNKFPVYKTFVLAGTVVDKNNVKKTVTLLTEDGIAICKLGDDLFSKINKVVKTGDVKNDPWTTKGTNLVLLGVRDGNSFRVKRNKNSTTILKILNTGYWVSLQKRD